MNSSTVAPPSTFANRAETGARVLRNTPSTANLLRMALGREAAYFASRMNVGATPDNVEKPDGPTAVSQLEQPCTLPK